MLRFRSLATALSALFASTSCISESNTQFPFISTLQHRANNPIEDRVTYAKLNQYKGIKGYTVSVFDGHGGALVAEFAANHINRFLNQRIKANLDKHPPATDIIIESLKQAYDDVENAYLAIFKQNQNVKEYRRVGACAITAVVLKDKVYVGNAGDCQGIIVGSKGFKKTNLRLNSGQQFEKDRLKALFPNQEDIVMCVPNTNYCYVKGRLQPTRSFGDFHLKYKEYNFSNLKTFTGPYIDHRPLITEFPINQDDKYLMLATDGLWDELTHEQVHQIWKRKDNTSFIKRLFVDAYINVSKRNGKSFGELDQIINRRDLHDDISIVTVDLEQLRKTI